jgi:hypothetical protein
MKFLLKNLIKISFVAAMFIVKCNFLKRIEYVYTHTRIIDDNDIPVK